MRPPPLYLSETAKSGRVLNEFNTDSSKKGEEEEKETASSPSSESSVLRADAAEFFFSRESPSEGEGKQSCNEVDRTMPGSHAVGQEIKRIYIVHDVENLPFCSYTHRNEVDIVAIYDEIIHEICRVANVVNVRSTPVAYDLVLPSNCPERVFTHPTTRQLRVLETLGCNYVQVVDDKKGAADQKIKHLLQNFSKFSTAQGTLVVLISSDRDFVQDLRDMQHKNFLTMRFHDGIISEGVGLYPEFSSRRWRAICDEYTSPRSGRCQRNRPGFGSGGLREDDAR